MASAPQALYRSACRTLTQKVGGVALPASAVGEGGGGSLGTVAHPEREQSPEVDGEASGFSTVARPTAFNFLNPKPPGSVTLAQVSEQERSGSRGLRPASTLMTPPMAAPLPCRGTAYQPRARPWGSQGPEAPRFEGTPHGDARRARASFTAMRRSFRAHRFAAHSTQGVALGWYAKPRWGSPSGPHRATP